MNITETRSAAAKTSIRCFVIIFFAFFFQITYSHKLPKFRISVINLDTDTRRLKAVSEQVLNLTLLDYNLNLITHVVAAAS